MFLSSVIAFFNKWEIHFMISVSMLLQIILIFTGYLRKYSANRHLQLLVWLAYSSADWWATISLGVLSCRAGCLGDNSIDPRFAISSFFAPFFLLHLGGPDTITAYSLEDNELWNRNSLTLSGQVVVAFYVIYRGWKITALNILAIPMFIPGIIQIFERLWAMKSASSENFKASMLRPADGGPNYARYMEEFFSKEDEGFDVKEKILEPQPVVDLPFIAPENVMIADAAILKYAYIFFDTFKQLLADLILSFQDIDNSRSFFCKASYDVAFKLIEVELRFMYDVFYTKAFKVYSLKWGILRFISFLSPLIALWVFRFSINKEAYSRGDKAVTYVVLGGGFVLELCALLIQLNSDWTMIWLSEHRNDAVDLLYKTISWIPLVRRKRWSNTMAQYKLIEYCLKDKHRYQDSVKVSDSLKELIFEQLRDKSESASDLNAFKELWACRGDRVLKDAKCPDCINREERPDCINREERRTEQWSPDTESVPYTEFEPVSINAKCTYEISAENQRIIKESLKVDFDQSILLWHIATTLCYNSIRSTAQTVTPNTIQITAQNPAQSTTQNMTPSMAQNPTQNSAQNPAQSTTQNLAQDMTPNMAQNLAQSTTQNLAQNTTQNMAQNQAPNTTQNTTPNPTQNSAQNPAPSMTQILAQSTTPNIAQNEAPNTTQSTTPNQTQNKDPNCEASKWLSNYMLYLLAIRPIMLPNGIGQIRFRDTCAETTEFLEDRKIFDEIQACTKLLEVYTKIPPSKVKGDRSKSVLFEGCRLAKSLQCLETKAMWDLISCVWIESLCYAARNCRSNHHAQQLTQGGELLTHVWLLMAHLGITEQFQISKGHARATMVAN